jgi:hypothetical protein
MHLNGTMQTTVTHLNAVLEAIELQISRLAHGPGSRTGTPGIADASAGG